MTKKEMFAKIATVCANDSEIVDFVNHEIELLNKKNARPKKATKTQIENETLKDSILDVLRNADHAMTATEIGDALGVSVNKASALISQLKEDNSVVREVIKRKAYFSIA